MRNPRRLLQKAHLLRWRPWPHAQRTGSTPRVRPAGAASHLDLFEQPAKISVFESREERVGADTVRARASPAQSCSGGRQRESEPEGSLRASEGGRSPPPRG